MAIISPASNVKNGMDDGIVFDRDIFENVYKKYTEYEFNENVMDFDDLILNTIKLFEQENKVLNYYRNRFKYILVDEFQDTNPQQYK
ncbi:UvrD-helicase domain-containing protein, partial [Brachyspira hyodysenteriae]|uniref:UvrD-helicase domain-containing protein n=1 Tax=Brachyspira hyodysenteriae TaxID=159 RepID=UPI001F52D71A